MSLPADLVAAFDQIDFTHHSKIIVAVSGGSDSTALLVGFVAYCALKHIDCTPVCVSVDHRLRPESADEAQQVGSLCARLQLDHDVRVWAHDGVAGGVQNQARMARYGLLSDAALDHGASMVLTGHNRDDHYETVAMRAARAAGHGLAGIAPATCHRRAVWFVRPLLGVQRSALRHYLSQSGFSWLDDPSNDSDAFERVRVRKSGAAAVDGTVITAMQQARRLASNAAATIIGDKNICPHIDRDHGLLERGFAACPHADTALNALLMLIGKKAYGANEAMIGRALSFIADGQSASKLTLHGCLLHHIGGQVAIGREVRNGGTGAAGFDRLAPSFDVPLFNAIYVRLGETTLPPLPIEGAPC